MISRTQPPRPPLRPRSRRAQAMTCGTGSARSHARPWLATAPTTGSRPLKTAPRSHRASAEPSCAATTEGICSCSRTRPHYRISTHSFNRRPATHTAHDHLGPGPGPGRGSWAGSLAPVALSHWTLTAVTPGAGMAQTPPYQVTDPASGEVTETFPFATDAEVAEALAAATDAFAAWRLRPVAERAAVVKRIAELFTERAADLAALITKEMGKRPAQAVGEAQFCTDIFNYYADNGPRLIADKPLPGHDTARVEYRPVGPVLGVMPWNYPYYQVARFAAPNLIVGNTVILKHAENCPTSALAIAQIMKDAGVPNGVYVNLFATYEQVAAMIADPRLRGVSLTGSERAGTVVAETAGRNLKKVVLELGGSDPYIILDTDDVEDAAKTAWVTRMENVGQACNSNKRMIVMDDIY